MIATNNDYSIANVLVDGVSVGVVNTYTFNQVTKTIREQLDYIWILYENAGLEQWRQRDL